MEEHLSIHVILRFVCLFASIQISGLRIPIANVLTVGLGWETDNKWCSVWRKQNSFLVQIHLFIFILFFFLQQSIPDDFE